MKNHLIGTISGLTLAISLLATNAGLAADRISTCTGRTSEVREGEIRVNIINTNGQLKATLFEGTSLNSWNTYHVSVSAGTYSGADSHGRAFVAKIDGAEGTLIRAVAPDVNSASGVIELSNIGLSCKL